MGWLLTGNYQITTVLYYIIFLPGIVLHELILWLVAGALNVRAERSIRFPEQQEIGELRLNFIRLAVGTGAFKVAIITLVPIAAGLAALWAIATHVFDWQATVALLAPGGVDAVAQALSSLFRTADFWLWFYLAFVVANTMFPSLPAKLSARQKSGLVVLAPLLIFLGWRYSGAVNEGIAPAVEGLLGGLAIITVQVTLMNALVVLILGSVEALIERITGKSATFRDGKMLTMSRTEARALSAKEREARSMKRPEGNSKTVVPDARSIYDFKLPIPGPPGREPISRQVVAVLDLSSEDAEVKVEARRAEDVRAEGTRKVERSDWRDRDRRRLQR